MYIMNSELLLEQSDSKTFGAFLGALFKNVLLQDQETTLIEINGRKLIACDFPDPQPKGNSGS